MAKKVHFERNRITVYFFSDAQNWIYFKYVKLQCWCKEIINPLWYTTDAVTEGEIKRDFKKSCGTWKSKMTWRHAQDSQATRWLTRKIRKTVSTDRAIPLDRNILTRKQKNIETYNCKRSANELKHEGSSISSRS